MPEKLYTDRGADFLSKRLQKISEELEFEMIKGRPYYPQGKGKIERFFETMNQLLLCELPGYTPEDKPPQKPGLTIEELRRTFHAWVVNEYMQRKNDETGESHFDRWSRELKVPRMPESLNSLHMLLMTVPEDRLVRKTGIHTLNLRYINPDLQQGYIRESVVVRYDPSDVSKIFVFHENKFVCAAICPELADSRPSYKEIQNARSSKKNICAPQTLQQKL
ncbi:MAG: Mu transposase C-terminal domain-containing protein [Candidatus Obscuribacterales bacterium]|nr:Mu transposase C-terminal domain-containing protein [Candidatus Obscuribacterales bacterium]